MIKDKTMTDKQLFEAVMKMRSDAGMVQDGRQYENCRATIQGKELVRFMISIHRVTCSMHTVKLETDDEKVSTQMTKGMKRLSSAISKLNFEIEMDSEMRDIR